MTESRQAINKDVQMRSQIDADLLYDFSSCFRGNTNLLLTCWDRDDVALNYHGMERNEKKEKPQNCYRLNHGSMGGNIRKITWLRKPRRPAKGNNRQWNCGRRMSWKHQSN